MDDHSTIDRYTFQQLLASAFAVQESELDRQSLSAILDVQRSIESGTFDLDAAMLSIVSSARDVTHASGVAIGLLKADRITYCAGCGTSAALVGHHVIASLTVSAFTKTSHEILRVENAQRDSRIEADICRQFGASALLILPIYFDHVVAGVLEVRFSEPHAFQDREVRTYVLMAEQIEVALSKASQVEPANILAAEFAPALEGPEDDPEYADPLEDEAPAFWMGESSVPSLFERCQYKLATAKQSPAFQRSILFVSTVAHRARALAAHRPTVAFIQQPQIKQWVSNQRAKSFNAAQRAKHALASQRLRFVAGLQKVSDVARRPSMQTVGLVSAVVILAVSALIAYRSHRISSTLDPSVPKSAAAESEAASKPLPGKTDAQPELLQVKEVRQSTISRKRVRVADSEVQYFGDDVTVRFFTPKPAAQRTVIPKSHVAHIGKDVTVRYFTSPQPAVMPVSH